jgi:hypothetical protein
MPERDVEPLTDWQQIADDLASALRSFMAYDGYGQGGAADGNRGDWRGAERAEAAYDAAKRTVPDV